MMGGSQGGALTIAGAALDNRLNAIAPAIQFMGDFPDYFKVGAWPAAVAKKQQEAKKLAEAKKKEEDRKQAEKLSSKASSKYDLDARVRTGAYRIIGVSEVVTAKEGQSIKSLSQKYLGPGMECYVEALNGTSQLKPGQKVKIPKLELKKKK